MCLLKVHVMDRNLILTVVVLEGSEFLSDRVYWSVTWGALCLQMINIVLTELWSDSISRSVSCFTMGQPPSTHMSIMALCAMM